MTSPDIGLTIKKKRKAVEECIAKYKLPRNPAIDDSLLALKVVPEKSFSKKLAVLIMTYKRESTIKELATVSSQPAALIRELRNDGFIFQDDSPNSRFHQYKNEKGEICRRIVEFKPPKVEVKGKVRSIIEKSVAACVSAIEVYNKPDFKYREETFSILLVNAWELLLKARIAADGSNSIKAIQVIENGKPKLNRVGNPMTIDINNALNRLSNQGVLDNRCRDNILLLVEVRDNAIHFINKKPGFSKKVLEIGTASLRNYITAISEWFGKDLSEYNFYLMPMSFFHPTDIESFSIASRDKQIENLMNYFHQMENKHPSDENNSYNVSLQINMQFVRTLSSPSAMEMKFTDRDDAPKIGTTEENVFRLKYPLTYDDLVKKLRDRHSNFKVNPKFHEIMKRFADQQQYGNKFCRVRSTDVFNENKGSKKTYYSTQIVKEFDQHYTKK